MSAIKNKLIKHFINNNLIDFKKGQSKTKTISRILRNINEIQKSSESKAKKLWVLYIQKSKTK